MNLSKLTDSTLLSQTEKLVREERETTTAILHHLREIDRRKLFAVRGFGSLFEYCTRGLGYSESAAQRRIASMRLVRELPEIEEKIQNGELSLSVVAQAQRFFRQEAKTAACEWGAEKKCDVIRKLEGKSSREAEKELLSISSQPVAHLKERVRSVTETHTELKVVVKDDVLKDLETIKGLLAHKHPDLSLGELIAILAEMALKELDPAKEPSRSKKKNATLAEKTDLPEPAPATRKTGQCQSALPTSHATHSNPSTRTIPTAMKREVYRRSAGKCSYQDPKTGRICGSRYALEIHHIQAHAKGGPTCLENLTVLCRNHNARHALEDFGIEKVVNPVQSI